MSESEASKEFSVTPAEDRRRASAAIEAMLLMSSEPVPAQQLAAAVELPTDTTEELLAELQQFYDQTERGFELRAVAGGWRYHTRREYAPVISAAIVGSQPAKLSQAGLETLAVIAYRQPISRSRVSAVRGVNVDGVVRTLLARELIAEAGLDEQTGATTLVTTPQFLERLGLDTLAELPPLAPHLPEVADLEAELGQLATTPTTSAGEGEHE